MKGFHSATYPVGETPSDLDLLLPFAAVVLDDQRPLVLIQSAKTRVQAIEHRLAIAYRLRCLYSLEKLTGLVDELPTTRASQILEKHIRRESINITCDPRLLSPGELPGLQCYPVECLVGESVCIIASTKFKKAHEPRAHLFIGAASLFSILGKKAKKSVEIFLPDRVLMFLH